jgi:hypothetical protein
MKTISAVASGVMAFAIALLIYADIASATSPANAVAPNSLVEIIDGTITGPLIVTNNTKFVSIFIQLHNGGSRGVLRSDHGELDLHYRMLGG